ncbi:MAG: tRNA (adenosine(37)-N6)-threonylcarbamoyltransferase complex ATPase subunit type 1 TsaE [Piscirickettsiaceae bacterium]|nr:tRNA (adenosine(37)-N6)-threonylcarbamoyltransferase complex ATPase subunit type 1 TsaE [Piscirickettsiaceae bacterium]
MKIFLVDELATFKLGKKLAQLCPHTQFIIFLEGELGSGKTTFSRGILQELGTNRAVKSPTYALTERYDLAKHTVFHIDLYRISDPEELNYLGLEDYFSNNAIYLIEWASKGGNNLPNPDLIIDIIYQNNNTRIANLRARSTLGEKVHQKLK